MESLEKQIEALASGTEEILPLGDFKKYLSNSTYNKRPLNVKFGVDPTAPDLHLGHAVPLNKLKQFQDLGHKVTLIIGDFTAKVGDPSGRKATRPHLSEEEIKNNAKTYTEQAFKILDKAKTKVVFNSHWLGKMDFASVLDLTGKFTVARLLERDDFNKRYSQGIAIGLHEFMYPLMQAYDSVHIKSDIELGGTDQTFNMLAGRELQERNNQKPQVVITVPILEGIDGVQKMSKSLGNHIGLTEPPEQIFGKVMSIPDSLMVKYFKLTTGVSLAEVEKIEKGFKSGRLDPAETKRILAQAIVKIYYTDKEAKAAQEHFDRVFKEQQAPSNIEEITINKAEIKNSGIWPVKLLRLAGFVQTNGEGRRLIEQKGAYLNDNVIENAEKDVTINNGDVLRSGRRKFVRIKITNG